MIRSSERELRHPRKVGLPVMLRLTRFRCFSEQTDTFVYLCERLHTCVDGSEAMEDCTHDKCRRALLLPSTRVFNRYNSKRVEILRLTRLSHK